LALLPTKIQYNSNIGVLLITYIFWKEIWIELTMLILR